jgi:hypothetical protein
VAGQVRGGNNRLLPRAHIGDDTRHVPKSGGDRADAS